MPTPIQEVMPNEINACIKNGKMNLEQFGDVMRRPNLRHLVLGEDFKWTRSEEVMEKIIKHLDAGGSLDDLSKVKKLSDFDTIVISTGTSARATAEATESVAETRPRAAAPDTPKSLSRVYSAIERSDNRIAAIMEDLKLKPTEENVEFARALAKDPNVDGRMQDLLKMDEHGVQRCIAEDIARRAELEAQQRMRAPEAPRTASDAFTQSAQSELDLRPISRTVHADFLQRLQRSSHAQEILDLCKQNGNVVEAIIRNPEWHVLVDTDPERLVGALQRYSIPPGSSRQFEHVTEALRRSFEVFDQDLNSLAQQLRRFKCNSEISRHRKLLHAIRNSDEPRGLFALIERHDFEWVARELTGKNGKEKIANLLAELGDVRLSPEAEQFLRELQRQNIDEIRRSAPPVGADEGGPARSLNTESSPRSAVQPELRVVAEDTVSQPLAREAAVPDVVTDEDIEMIKRAFPDEAAKKLDVIFEAQPDLKPDIVAIIRTKGDADALKYLDEVHNTIRTQASEVVVALPLEKARKQQITRLNESVQKHLKNKLTKRHKIVIQHIVENGITDDIDIANKMKTLFGAGKKSDLITITILKEVNPAKAAGFARRVLAQRILGGRPSWAQWRVIEQVHNLPLEYPEYPKSHPDGHLHPDDVQRRFDMLREGVEIDGKTENFDPKVAGQLIDQRVCGSDDAAELAGNLQEYRKTHPRMTVDEGGTARRLDTALESTSESPLKRSPELGVVDENGVRRNLDGKEVSDAGKIDDLEEMRSALTERAVGKLDGIKSADGNLYARLTTELADMDPKEAAKLIDGIHNAVENGVDVVRYVETGGNLADVSDFAKTAKTAGKWAKVFKALDVGGAAFDAFALAYTAYEWNETTNLIANTQNNEELREKYEQRYYFHAAEAAISGAGLVAGGMALAGAGGAIATPVVLATIPVSAVVGAGYAWHKWEESNARTAEDWAREYSEQELMENTSAFSFGEKVGSGMSMLFGDRNAFEQIVAFSQIIQPGAHGPVMTLASPRAREDMERVGKDAVSQLGEQVRAIVEKTSIVQMPVKIRIEKEGVPSEIVSVNDPNKSEYAKKMFAMHKEAVRRYYEAKVQYLVDRGRGEPGAAFSEKASASLFPQAEACGRIAHDRYVASKREDTDVLAYLPKEDDPIEKQASAYRDIIWKRQAAKFLLPSVTSRSGGERVNEKGERILLSAETAKFLSNETQAMLFTYLWRIRSENYRHAMYDFGDAEMLVETYINARYDVRFAEESEKLTECIQKNAKAIAEKGEDISSQELQEASDNIENQMRASVANVNSLFTRSPRDTWLSFSDAQSTQLEFLHGQQMKLQAEVATIQQLKEKLQFERYEDVKEKLHESISEHEETAQELYASMEKIKWKNIADKDYNPPKAQKSSQENKEQKKENAKNKEKTPGYIQEKKNLAKRFLQDCKKAIAEQERRISKTDFPGILGDEKASDGYARYGASRLIEGQLESEADAILASAKEGEVSEKDYESALIRLKETIWSKNPVEYMQFWRNQQGEQSVFSWKGAKEMLTVPYLMDRIEKWN